jgi:hypothetical protein
MTAITKEEWIDWKTNNKVTVEFLRRLMATREGLKEGIAEGRAEGSEELYKCIGQCQGLKDAIDYAIISFDVVDKTEDME